MFGLKRSSDTYQVIYPILQSDLDGNSVCASQTFTGGVALQLNTNSPYYNSDDGIVFALGADQTIDDMVIFRRLVFSLAEGLTNDVSFIITGASNNIDTTETVTIVAGNVSGKSINYYDSISAISGNSGASSCTVFVSGDVDNGGMYFSIPTLDSTTLWQVNLVELPTQQNSITSFLQLGVSAYEDITEFTWYNLFPYCGQIGQFSSVSFTSESLNASGYIFPAADISISGGDILIFVEAITPGAILTEIMQFAQVKLATQL